MTSSYSDMLAALSNSCRCYSKLAMHTPSGGARASSAVCGGAVQALKTSGNPELDESTFPRDFQEYVSRCAMPGHKRSCTLHVTSCSVCGQLPTGTQCVMHSSKAEVGLERSVL
jgi:hypothetical protein